MRIGSEEEVLSLVDKYFSPYSHTEIILPRGDDCAIYQGYERMCVSSDLFLEDVHFKRRYFPPYFIGLKALTVNITDILSMGANPLGFNMGLILPPSISISFLEEFLKGMADMASRFHLYLAGGDISSGGIFGVDITIWGRVGERFFQRNTGKVGDYIFVTGEIGLSRAGLMALERGLDPSRYGEAIRAHLSPHICATEAGLIRDNPHITSLMDLSDGIARDLPRLLSPRVGAHLEIKREELSPEVVEMAREVGEDPLEFALRGGEEYCFLGTIEEEGISSLLTEVPRTKVIGRIVSEKGIRINSLPLHIEGFDHFKHRRRLCTPHSP